MSRFSITIGERTFSSKSKALEFYKDILHSYEVGEELSEDDLARIVDLWYREFSREEVEAYEAETGDHIRSVTVDYHPEFKSTKCFFLSWNHGEQHLLSYTLLISGALSDSRLFSRACRHLVAGRLRDFKKQKFKNRPVKCAVTNEVVEWEECQVDHKAPLTFSVIVKSFIPDPAFGVDPGLREA